MVVTKNCNNCENFKDCFIRPVQFTNYARFIDLKKMNGCIKLINKSYREYLEEHFKK